MTSFLFREPWEIWQEYKRPSLKAMPSPANCNAQLLLREAMTGEIVQNLIWDASVDALFTPTPTQTILPFNV